MEILAHSHGNSRGNSDPAPDGTYTIIREGDTVTILKDGDVLYVEKRPADHYSVIPLGVRESCSGSAYAGDYLPQTKASAGSCFFSQSSPSPEFENAKEEILKGWVYYYEKE